MPTAPEQGEEGEECNDGRYPGHISREDLGEPERPHRQLCTKRDSAFNALFTFATSDPAEECKRRLEAIIAVTALCWSQDPPGKKVCRRKQAHAIAGGVDGHQEVAKNKPEPKSTPSNAYQHSAISAWERPTWLSKSARVPSAPVAT
jgi:hypothetical protein